ncbi:retrovirus-related Pol polyprotein from transposon TNT 1-94 [Trichonephila clavipes]|nr:retrovirus-related Pol polyprotein from transposon TNT 1-94 [Trichonephila clavipes]
MDKITIPDLNGTNYFIWELKMKAALSLKRLDPLILEEKPEDLTRKDEMDWITKNSDAIAYIKLSLADEQALQFAAEDNAKVLWDKIRATYMGEGEDRKIDAGNELKNIRMKNGETVADYIARARGISTKCHSLGLGVSPRELVYHTVRGLNGKFSKMRDILKTQRGKSMDEILQILREEEATLNLPIKTRMDGINEAFYYSQAAIQWIKGTRSSNKSRHMNLRFHFIKDLIEDTFTCRNCGGGDRGRVAIYRPFGEVSLSLNRTVTCMVLKANDRRTSCPCHDEFRGPRSDYVRQVALATTTTTTKNFAG